MSATDPRELFVFAGAGASFGMPASLPMFNAIRDELLRQIGLGDRVPAWPTPTSGDQLVVAGLAPEPFLLAVESAGAYVEQWLTEWLSEGSSNAVHHALGQLLVAGASVWTVNFDRLIETSQSPQLSAAAWPDPPLPKMLCKPHGSLGGSLVFTAADVLEPLSDAWAKRLEGDMATATYVLFIGYSARDLDLQPLWSRLTAGKHVIWFDVELPDEELRRRRAVLRLAASIDFAGQTTPRSPTAVGAANPSTQFVDWCQQNTDTRVAADLIAQLTAPRVRRNPPRLAGDTDLVKAAILLILGDSNHALRVYLRRVVCGPARRRNFGRALAIVLNVGFPGLVTGLRLASIVKGPGALTRFGATARRKHLTLVANAGNHQKVLRATRDLHEDDTSTLLILRSASLRITGQLPSAVDTASRALVRARAERHNVRIAHAAMQLCYAQMWSGRIDEAEATLADHLRPMAALAATRWVAWADVLDASLAIHRNAPERALELLQSADQRFLAEGLVDGSVSALTVQLTAMRQADDAPGFRDTLTRLNLIRNRHGTGHYYARGHTFSQEAVTLEFAEFHADFEGAPAESIHLLRRVSKSNYLIHAAIAELYLSRHVDDPERQDHETRAMYLGASTGAEKVMERARQAQQGDRSPSFFP